MPEIDMPEGQYFSLSGSVRAGTGGQTRALLMRNRLFAQRAGLAPVILTIEPAPVYAGVREGLRAQGQLVDPMRLLNIFEWYRDTSLDDVDVLDEELPVIEGFDTEDERHPDGTVYVTKYVHRRSREEAIHDYRRPDGSVYLRHPAGPSMETNPVTPVVLVNRHGRPVGRWARAGGWHQRWLSSLAVGDGPVFVISDSRFALSYVVPNPDPRFHFMHLMHNAHTVGARRWNSPLAPTYAPLLESISHLDGLVTLTDRQREDVGLRFGSTNNLFVVPNPVEIPARPDPLPPRAAKRFAVVSRLERQKRLEHAIRAFGLVVAQEPDATLDIYGDGGQRIHLQEEIDALGLEKSVTLRGHDPSARNALWTATAMLMTSRQEGYPLATLESMSHGCPVISYDIKYGPREQVTHGVDGFLVEPEDIEGVAERVLELIRDPRLVARMSESAFLKAEQHDHTVFLNDWRDVVQTVARNRKQRTVLDSVTLSVSRLAYARPGPVPKSYRFRSGSASFRDSRRIEFKGKLTVRGRSEAATLDTAVLSLHAVCDKSGSMVEVPMLVERSDEVFRLTADLDMAELFNGVEDEAHALRLRLRLVWENSSWETTVKRSRSVQPHYEISFSDKDELHLHRGIKAPRVTRSEA